MLYIFLCMFQGGVHIITTIRPPNVTSSLYIMRPFYSIYHILSNVCTMTSETLIHAIWIKPNYINVLGLLYDFLCAILKLFNAFFHLCSLIYNEWSSDQPINISKLILCFLHFFLSVKLYPLAQLLATSKKYYHTYLDQ